MKVIENTLPAPAGTPVKIRIFKETIGAQWSRDRDRGTIVTQKLYLAGEDVTKYVRSGGRLYPVYVIKNDPQASYGAVVQTRDGVPVNGRKFTKAK